MRQIKLQAFKRDFENLKMKSSKIVKEYSSRISYVMNQMNIYGNNIFYQHVVQKILLFILVKFDSIISAIDQSRDVSKLFAVELLGAFEE